MDAAHAERFKVRFYAKVGREDPVTGCWPWLARCCKRTGVPLVTVAMSGRWEAAQAHRVAYAMEFGPIAGTHLRHTCGNTACVNPWHVHPGTGPRRGAARSPRYLHHHARVSVEDVRAIREAHASGTSQRALARVHGLRQSSIGDIVHRRTWRHVE